MSEKPRRFHVMDTLRDVCLACGATAYQITESRALTCDGVIQYREYLLPKTVQWVREPIIPTGARA